MGDVRIGRRVRRVLYGQGLETVSPKAGVEFKGVSETSSL